MDPQTKLLIACFVAGAFAFVYATTRVLGDWHDYHLKRHDLIVASKQRRINYYQSLAEREAQEFDELMLDQDHQPEDPQDTSPAPAAGRDPQDALPDNEPVQAQAA